MLCEGRAREGRIGRFGHEGGGRGGGDHFVVFGAGGVRAGVDGDEVRSLCRGTADEVDPADEHRGSAYEEESPYAVELE